MDAASTSAERKMIMDEYIERKAAIDAIISEPPDAHYPSWYADNIMSIPAADVAPVQHGRWDENGRCTVCGGHAPYWSMASTYYESPYCFECGAKMDLEG